MCKVVYQVETKPRTMKLTKTPSAAWMRVAVKFPVSMAEKPLPLLNKMKVRTIVRRMGKKSNS